MMQTGIGIATGMLAWVLLWIFSDVALAALLPGRYGREISNFQTAFENAQPFRASWFLLGTSLFRAIAACVVAGFVAATVARENVRSSVGLGGLLLVSGVMIQAALWNQLPLWYHAVFLLMIVPMTILGGNFRPPRLLP